MANDLNSIKIYFGFVEDIEDTENLFRIRAKIKGYTDEIEKENLPWYYPWYGINYLPEIGDEIPIVIFNDEFTHGFYEKKADIVLRGELSKEDYNTYLELYKRDSDKVSITYRKSKGIELEYDTAKQTIDKDKIVSKVNDTTVTVSDDMVEVIVNQLILKMTDEGFLIKKGGETMKKLWSDLCTKVSEIQFQNNNGKTITMLNKTEIIKMKTRGEDFFTNG